MQKKIVIFHGTDANSQANWFPWLSQQLTTKGHLVWTPDLPQSNKPNINRYNKFISTNQPWSFDQNTTFIGHSSGAVAILGLLESLPKNITINTAILIGSFKNDLQWDALKELFATPFDFSTIKTKAKRFIFIHSDNDPYCPLDHAEYLSHQLNGKLIIQPGQKHFSIGTMGIDYKQFPFLLQLVMEL